MAARVKRLYVAPSLTTAEFVASIWIGFALLSLVHASHQFYSWSRCIKRNEASVPTAAAVSVPSRFQRAAQFHINGRYGRSDPFLMKMKNAPKLVEVSPRMDRFFLGSRYGKRSSNDQQSIVHQDYHLNELHDLLDFVGRAERETPSALEVKRKHANDRRIGDLY